ncbi:hypothetical protein [Streptomyces griseosporeus]|uniref:hypothetical protein n=1 Tax=Streptomyces griseosporeus TaxID=1910 RepID=UPI0036F7E451
MTDPFPPAPATPPQPPPAFTAPAAARKPLSPLAAGVLGLALGAGLMGAVWAVSANSGSGEPATFTLEGTFTLTDRAVPDADDGCSAASDSGYDDIAEGTSVTVYGAGGDVIATGQLGTSRYTDFTCEFDIAVPDVPKGEKFYKVEVSHRGTIQLTAEEAENGELAATLG